MVLKMEFSRGKIQGVTVSKPLVPSPVSSSTHLRRPPSTIVFPSFIDDPEPLVSFATSFSSSPIPSLRRRGRPERCRRTADYPPSGVLVASAILLPVQPEPFDLDPMHQDRPRRRLIPGHPIYIPRTRLRHVALIHPTPSHVHIFSILTPI